MIEGLKRKLKAIVRKAEHERNKRMLVYLANLRPDANVKLSSDENKMLETMVKYLRPSGIITRGGKIVFKAPSVEEVSLWDMLEARRAETATGTIEAWTGGKYSPDTVIDAVRLSKYISEQVKIADGLEEALFAGMEGTENSDDPIKQAKNLLGLVQITAELFHCSFEEAKRVNYSDAMLAIAKRNDEIERENKRIKEQQNRQKQW